MFDVLMFDGVHAKLNQRNITHANSSFHYFPPASYARRKRVGPNMEKGSKRGRKAVGLAQHHRALNSKHSLRTFALL